MPTTRPTQIIIYSDGTTMERSKSQHNFDDYLGHQPITSISITSTTSLPNLLTAQQKENQENQKYMKQLITYLLGPN